MKYIKNLSLVLACVLVTFTSCKDDDEKFDINNADFLPSVEKTTIAVNEELEIIFSSTDDDGFSYEIADGNTYISVIEQDNIHYIIGKEPGESTLTLTNNAGTETLTINVEEKVEEVEEVEKEGDYYVDNQGIRYNIDFDNNTASVAGDPGSPTGEEVGANSDVDFSSVDGVITIPVNIFYDGEEYPVNSIESFSFRSIDPNSEEVYGNETIKELHFADNSLITTIDEFAFGSCSNLSIVDFSNCASLITIEKVAFQSCNALESIDFTGCTSLTTISEYAFSNCANLSSVDFTTCTSLTTIENLAFAFCFELSNVNMSDCTLLATIGEQAFGLNSNLSSVDLSGCVSLTNVGFGAFNMCDNELTVMLPGGGWYNQDNIDLKSGTITKTNWMNKFSRRIY